MSQTLTEYSGFLGSATINNGGGAVEIPIREWKLTSSVRITPDTNSMSGPYPLLPQSYLSDTVSATISRNFGVGQTPYSIGISRGTVLTQMFLYEYQTTRGMLGSGGYAHTLTSLVVSSVNVSTPVAGGQVIPVSFTATVQGPGGTYTPPPAT